MESEFTNDELRRFFALFHFVVNRNQGMYRQVEDLTSNFPYPFQQKIIDICDNQDYLDFLDSKDDLVFASESSEAVVRFPLLSVSDAEKIEQKFDWIIEPLFSRGSLSVVVGASGSLKTYTMLHSGLCVAAGKNWLGFRTKQVPVLYVDEESGKERISYRIRQIIKGESLPSDFPFMFSPMPRLDFSQDNSIILLRDQIVKHKFRFVIIDSMVDVIGDADENSANAINPVLMGLSQLAKETKTAIVLIHHTGKDNKYRGTSAIPGAVDLMLYVKKSQEKILSFSTIKARDIDDDLGFTARFNFGVLKDTFSLGGGAISKSKMSTTESAETRIIDFLSKNPDSTIQQITVGLKGFEYDYDYLRILIGKMEEKGIIRNTIGGGRGKTGKFQILE